MKGDIIGFKPDRRFGFVIKSNQVGHLHEETLDVLLSALKNNESPKFTSFNEETIMFQFPLRNGQKYGGDVTRKDQMYMYVVKRDGYFLRQINGKSENIPRYTVGYSSIGDELSYTFVPTIGITAVSYHHNGSTYDVELELLDYHV